MKLFFTALFLLAPFISFAQQSSEELIEKKKKINQRIVVLQDSLQELDEKISYLKLLRNISTNLKESDSAKTKTPSKKVEASVVSTGIVPNIDSVVAAKNFKLRSQRYEGGEVLREIEKGTNLQIVDRLGNYYLICINGDCGYAHKEVLNRPLKSSTTKELGFNDKEMP